MLAEQQKCWKEFLLGLTGKIPPVRDSSAKFLSIYRSNVLGALIRTLGLAYPGVKQALGDVAFESAALAHARENPPARAQLNAYGAGFADGLAVRHPDRPWLAALGELEWILHRAYFAADEKALDPACLIGLADDDTARLRLAPQAGLRVLPSSHPVVALHAHYCAGHEFPDPATPQTALIWRKGHDVLLRALEPGEAALLNALCTDRLLFDAAQAALEADARFNLQAVLSRHLADGLYVEARLNGGPL